MAEVVAVIDCGSNSTRLLTRRADGTVLHRETRITRLSEGVDASRRLTEAAMGRSLAVIDEYRAIMDADGADDGVLVATSAVRDAANGAEFLAAAGERARVEARILTGVEEARFSYDGATADLPADDRATVVLDVGGGSTELAAEVDGELVSYSMQLGCVRVTERALGRDPATPERVAAARALIDARLDEAMAARPELGALGAVRLVGLAGTVSTLAQMDAGEAQYRREAVHHRRLALATAVAWRDRLAAETPTARLEHPGMVRGREDVLTAGLFVVTAVMARLGARELLTSENDILDGVAASR